jgi:signal transduction histidine kinase
VFDVDISFLVDRVRTRISNFLGGAPHRLITAQYLLCVLVSALSAFLLNKGRFGDLGGVIAFLTIVAASWFCGPGPAVLSPLSLMLSARYLQNGLDGVLSNYSAFDLTNLFVFTVVMATVGWAGKMRRKSLQVVRDRERQLREQARHKDEFLATLAHELRNPLAPLSSGLALLRHYSQTEPDPEKLAEIQEMMQRQLGHMIRLVDELLDISRINSGKIVLRTESLQLKGVIEDAIHFAKPHIEGAGHLLQVSAPESPMLVQADRARLVQVISNLLNNAAKFTPRGGRIHLEAQSDGTMHTIKVTDSGIGLAAESLERVFDMFAQVTDVTTREQGGLGIGLSLSRYLVQLHGGTIEARSAGLGKGATFIVRLPCQQSVPEAEPAPEQVQGEMKLELEVSG